MRALIAIDGSDASFEAVRQAGLILSPQRDAITLYYAPPMLARTTLLDQAVFERGRQALAESVFGKAGSFLPVAWSGPVERIVGNDDRAGILDAAERCNADFIAVGAGLGFIDRIWLGSVSRSVVHAAKVPVLVARQGKRPRNTADLRVLLACENASTGQEIARVLHQFTWPAGTNGSVLQVLSTVYSRPIPPWLDTETRSFEVEQLVKVWVADHDAELAQARKDMQKFSQLLPDPFISRVPRVVDGMADEMILLAAKELGTDLIVVGAKNSTPLGRLLLGSTCEAVLNTAPCSVLVVHHQPVPTPVCDRAGGCRKASSTLSPA